MTTLGELFDAALAHLAAAARDPGTPADLEDRAALVGSVDHVLQEIRTALGPGTPPEQSPIPAAKDLEGWLSQASGWLSRARPYLHAPGDVTPAGPSRTRIEAAARAVAAVRDTIGSHLGPDGAPRTPYACLLRDRAAVEHLASRYAEVGRAAGQVVHRIARNSDDPGAAEALAGARAWLDQASVLTRTTSGDAAPHLAAFPHALPVIPVQAAQDDPTTAVTARLAEDCERLSTAAYTTLHDREAQPLTGPDLHDMAHWNSLSRLLAGRVLLTAAERMPHADGTTADEFRRAAAALRDSADAWGKTAAAWHRAADLGELPALPGCELLRRGQTAPPPEPTPAPFPDPHPAAVISRTTATRLGRLLFGAHWSPPAAPGPVRPPGEILADAGGPGPLAASLYRLPATGWQLASIVPRVVERAGGPPVHRRRVAAFAEAYSAVMAAEQRSAGQLLHAARRAGTTVPRAVLDAVAHRALATALRSAPTHQVRPAHRPVLRAAAPRNLMTGQRIGLS
ncbi:hypothetical protein ACFVGY_06875 [Streptomyces sp. NPDC127106]|uniref:hypothetical protein n=1 Tax=Streptomyces sp. NPDC127106 TaxID=3345360 RepID=UPI00363A4D7E